MGDAVGAYVVEQADERWVVLSIDLGEFYAYQLEFPEHMCVEKELRGVEGTQQLSVLITNDGFELEDVAHEKHLLSTEWDVAVSRIDTQHLVDEIDDVGPDHADFIDDH